jgi:hypothetical protein
MVERCAIRRRFESTAALSDINVREEPFGICVRKSCNVTECNFYVELLLWTLLCFMAMLFYFAENARGSS